MNINQETHDQTIALFRACGPLFSALADRGRQDIIVLLTEQKGMSVNQITDHIGLSQPTVSHHLRLLREVGLVKVQQTGTTRLYCLTFEGQARLLRKLIDAAEGYHANQGIKGE